MCLSITLTSSRGFRHQVAFVTLFWTRPMFLCRWIYLNSEAMLALAHCGHHVKYSFVTNLLRTKISAILVSDWNFYIFRLNFVNQCEPFQRIKLKSNNQSVFHSTSWSTPRGSFIRWPPMQVFVARICCRLWRKFSMSGIRAHDPQFGHRLGA